ncbi:MAG: hypothetical protein AAB820_02120, partial [Patescibacteria group bacterium]
TDIKIVMAAENKVKLVFKALMPLKRKVIFCPMPIFEETKICANSEKLGIQTKIKIRSKTAIKTKTT